MRRIVGTLAVAAGMVIGTQANAETVLFSDSLQTSLATPNWGSNNSGQIVAAPGGGNALNFASLGSGGDLFSKIIGGTGSGRYRLTVSYLCATVGGCGAFIGLHPGGSVTTLPPSQGTDNWLATDTPAAYPAPFLLTSAGGAFTTNTFNFRVSSAGAFGLKLEDFNGTAGDAYFRDISLTAVPEPAAWALMIGGFGLVGGAMRRRRRMTTTVRFA